jgi:hypothetical protein
MNAPAAAGAGAAVVHVEEARMLGSALLILEQRGLPAALVALERARLDIIEAARTRGTAGSGSWIG